jgi:subtilase family serine protease
MKSSINWVFTQCKAWAWLTLPSAALLILVTAPAGAAELQKLRGHVPAAVARLAPVGQLPGSQRLNLAIGLPLRNREALTNLLHDLYDPTSPIFRQYLTPQQFTARFGPSEEDYQAVIAFARANGLTVTVKHSNRVLLDVSGSVADIEKAFQVTLRVYQHPVEKRTFYAPDAEPSVGTTVPILDISGLDNYSIPLPALHRMPISASPVPASGSGPSGSYLGYDFRNAYATSWLTRTWLACQTCLWRTSYWMGSTECR